MPRTLKDMFLEKASQNVPPSKYAKQSYEPFADLRRFLGQDLDIDRGKIATEGPPFTYYADALPTPLGIPLGQILLDLKKSDVGRGNVLNFEDQVLQNSTAAPSENDIDPRLARVASAATMGASALGMRKKTPLKLGDSMVLAKYKTLSYPEIMMAGMLGGKKYEAGAPKKGMIDSIMSADVDSMAMNVSSTIFGGDYLKGPSNYDHLDIKDIDSMYQRKWSLKKRSFLNMGVVSTTFKFKNPIERADSLNLLPPIKIKKEKGYVKKIINVDKDASKEMKSIANAAKDLIPFAIKDLRTDKVYFFRAFISSLSDSFSANWSQVNYLGNPNTYYSYGGLGRTLSLTFRLHAFSKIELEFIWKKCQDLVEMTSPKMMKNENSQFYLGLVAPMIEITIGDYLVEQPCIINTLNFTFEESIPWEVDAEESGISKVPHGVSVSMDIAYVGKDVFTTNYRYFDTKMLKEIKDYDAENSETKPIVYPQGFKRTVLNKKTALQKIAGALNETKEAIDKGLTAMNNFADALTGNKHLRDYDMLKAYDFLKTSNKLSSASETEKKEYDREIKILRKYLTLK